LGHGKAKRIIEIKSKSEIRHASLCQKNTPNSLRPAKQSPKSIEEIYGAIPFVMPKIDKAYCPAVMPKD